MPIIETRGSLSSRGYGQFAQGAAAPPPGPGAYIEDVFGTTLYSGTGASQFVQNNIALSGATTPGWIATLGAAGGQDGTGIAVNAAGNVYVAGTSTPSGTNNSILAKYNSSGTLQSQGLLSSVGVFLINSLAVSSSGETAFCGRTTSPGASAIVVSKYGANDAIQWSRAIGGSNPSFVEQGRSVAFDGSGNVYVAGATTSSGSNDILLAKFDTSGNIQWQKTLSSAGSDQAYGVATDSSGNVYITGNAGSNAIVVKYNSSGAIQWQRVLSAGAANPSGYSVATDGSGNVYICGYFGGVGGFDAFVAKYDTSGILQWQKSLVGSSGDFALSIAVDGSGNAYVCGQVSISSVNNILIAKYNASGVLQWQRRIGSSESTFASSITVDGSGSIYICGSSTISTDTNFILAKLPSDGSGVGTYTVGGATFLYASSNLTDSTPSFTDSAGALVDATSSLTVSTPSFFTSSPGLTSSVTPLFQSSNPNGLVWIKGRSGATDHALYDTARGATLDIASNLATGQTIQSQGLTEFGGNGFLVGTLAKINTNAAIYGAWTFAKQSKFFDVVTYTGNGVSGRTVSHSLGSVPGCIMIKRTDATGFWQVYHRSLGSTQYLILNRTDAAATAADRWNNTTPTASVFTLGNVATVNDSGGSYVAYLFAHDAGGFGASGTDNAISCGSYTTTAGGVMTAPVNLGWEPQWILVKRVDAARQWILIDSVRGNSVVSGTTSNQAYIYPNATDAEILSYGEPFPLATGFNATATVPSGTFIYIAVRRGPMRTPTLGTSVFVPTVYTGTNVDNRLVNTSIAPDMVWVRQRNDSVLGGMVVGDRLRGQPYLLTGTNAADVNDPDSFDAQLVGGAEYGTAFSSMNGFWCGNDPIAKLNVNTSSNNHIAEAFRRAPGFFDVVCYTGTGVNATINHNLGVVPELIIVKARAGTNNWQVYSNQILNSQYFILNNDSAATSGSDRWNNTTPTSTTFTVGTSATVNGPGTAYVAYLFASCPGVSKIGSYLATGSTVQVNCGFTTGARFALIKVRGTGSWYVWDSARGITPAADPYLVLNSTAAEVSSTDWIDSLASGFEVSNAAGNLVNGAGNTYTFLAIA